MKLRAFWMLGLALILAGTSVFLARNWIEKQVQPQVVQEAVPQIELVTVVVAATPLYFGNNVRREHLREIDWPADATPPGAFTTIDEILGVEDEEERVALRAIEVNEPILRSKISGFGGRASLSSLLAPEMRASTIRVNDVNGVAGFVLPGDHVDIMLTRSASGGKGGRGAADLITDVLLQNIRVLGIDQDANEQRDKPGVAKAVTLEVTSVQAQKLVLAQRLGELSLALRHVTNVEAESPTKTVSLRDLQVGEANLPPKPPGTEKKEKAATKTVIVKKTKKKAGLSVRIVRGMATSEYEVQADKRPFFSEPEASKPLDLAPQAPSAPKALTGTSGGSSFTQTTVQAPAVAKPVSAPLSLLEPLGEKSTALQDAAE
jgi:pilus assembly protein CpaB